MKKKAERETEREGSLTVEASLVMSLVLLTVFSMLLLTLGLRDRTALTCALQEGLYCPEDQAEAHLQAGLAELYALSGQLGEVSLEPESRRIACSGASGPFWPGQRISFTETAQRRICHPAEYLRLCRAVQLLAGDGEEEAD